MRIAPPAARVPWIDAARGIALVAMVIYHFSWDLRYFGYITADVEDALGWRIFARSVAGSFLFIVGVSLVLAMRRGFDPRRYLRRLGILVASAAAITIATWFVFPDAFIYFGILHQIAVASVLGLPFVLAPVPVTIAAAGLCFAAPHFLTGPVFDHWALLWLGLSTEYPRSNDFVPLFPWFGVVLAGIAAARLWPLLGLDHAALWRTAPIPRALLFVGRHTLLIYLLHQPILFGLVYLADQVHPPDLLGFEPEFLDSCVASCTESEVEPDICQRICSCTADQAQAEGLWAGLMRRTLSPDEENRYYALADSCRAQEEGE